MAGKISESTLIPISFILVLIGGAFWFTTMYWQGTANAKEIEQIKSNQHEYIRLVNEINVRLSNIEVLLRDRKFNK